MPAGFEAYARTVQHHSFLLDRQQEALDKLKDSNDRKDTTIAELKNVIAGMSSTIGDQENTIAKLATTIQEHEAARMGMISSIEELQAGRVVMADTAEQHKASIAEMTTTIDGLKSRLNQTPLNHGMNHWNNCHNKKADTPDIHDYDQVKEVLRVVSHGNLCLLFEWINLVHI